MLFFFIIPIGLGIGFLSGGRLSGLGKLQLRLLPLVFVALVIQLLIFPLFTSTAILPFAKVPLHILSYVLLGSWIVANIRMAPVVLLSLGAICNFSVLIATGARRCLCEPHSHVRHYSTELSGRRFVPAKMDSILSCL